MLGGSPPRLGRAATAAVALGIVRSRQSTLVAEFPGEDIVCLNVQQVAGRPDRRAVTSLAAAATTANRTVSCVRQPDGRIAAS